MSDPNRVDIVLRQFPDDTLDDVRLEDLIRMANSLGIHAWEMLRHFQERGGIS